MDNVNKQWAFIINPIAGNGFAKTIVPQTGGDDQEKQHKC